MPRHRRDRPKTAQNREEAFSSVNPCAHPVLELDDGTRIAESVAICRYFEDFTRNRPSSATSARRRPSSRCGAAGSNSVSMMRCAPPSATAIPAWRATKCPRSRNGRRQAASVRSSSCACLDDQLARHRFVAGDRYTIADITTAGDDRFHALPKLQVPTIAAMSGAGMPRWRPGRARGLTSCASSDWHRPCLPVASLAAGATDNRGNLSARNSAP